MQKRIVATVCVLVMLLQTTFAESVYLYEALPNLDIIVENKLKSEMDESDLKSAITIQRNTKQGLDLVELYQIAQTKKSLLRMKIGANTTVEKTKLGNKIKRLGYNLARNSTELAVQKLYLGTVSAKLNQELAQLKYDNQILHYLDHDFQIDEKYLNADM